MVTRYPLACSNLANDAAIIPFPKDEETPPVTKMYLVGFIEVLNVLTIREANVRIYCEMKTVNFNFTFN